MKKLPIYCSIDFLIHFYTEFDKLKTSNNQIDEEVFFLAMNFNKMLSTSELYFPKSDGRIKSILEKEDFPRLKNILKNARNTKDYEYSLLNEDNLKLAVEETPQAIFLIDKSVETRLGFSQNIQNDYGIFCFTNENWKEKATFLLNWAVFSIDKKLPNLKLSSWKELQIFKHPCNSMLIAENYILSKSDEIKDNLFEIFDALLPNKALKIPFQITILALNDELEGSKLTSRFNLLVSELSRIRPNFTFDIQIILVNKNENHDRNIITNYLWLHSGHSFSYFKNDTNLPKIIKSTNLMIFPISFQNNRQSMLTSNQKINSNSVFEAVQILLEKAKNSPKKEAKGILSKNYEETQNAKNRLLS